METLIFQVQLKQLHPQPQGEEEKGGQQVRLHRRHLQHPLSRHWGRNWNLAFQRGLARESNQCGDLEYLFIELRVSNTMKHTLLLVGERCFCLYKTDYF